MIALGLMSAVGLWILFGFIVVFALVNIIMIIIDNHHK